MRAVPLSRYLVFIGIVAGGVAADLATKRWVFDWLGMPSDRGSPVWWLWTDVIGFQTSLNQGALFGLGQGRESLFAVLAVAAALGLLWWLFWVGAARDWLLTVALGGVMAGVLGNLYDRLGMPGLLWPGTNVLHRAGEPIHAVRDWILVMIGKWPWPTFNVADSLLVCGAGLLMAQVLWTRSEEESPP